MDRIQQFYVIGLEDRTTNDREQSGQGVIGRLWSRLMGEGLYESIPDKEDSSKVVVYSDYESDEKGAYSYLLGARVSSIASVPSGMSSRTVLAGDYKKFTSARGPLIKVVPETWKQVWTSPQLHRKFATDFEIHDIRAKNQDDGQVDIYVGVK